MIGTDFYYDGEYSVNHGIYIVKMDSGLIQSPFLSEREALLDYIPGRHIPYFYDVQYQPLKFSITFSTMDNRWTLEKRREIARWFDKRQFKEFYSEDNVDLRYYLLYQGGIDLHTTGNLQGYIECEFLNISPYGYSPVYQKSYDLSTITIPTIIEFDNQGDDILYPELQIIKFGDGNLTIKNLTNGGKIFQFNNLVNNEIIYIDNQNRDIISNLYDTRLDDFNNNYLDLVRGINRLEVVGACKLDFRYQFIIKG